MFLERGQIYCNQEMVSLLPGHQKNVFAPYNDRHTSIHGNNHRRATRFILNYYNYVNSKQNMPEELHRDPRQIEMLDLALFRFA